MQKNNIVLRYGKILIISLPIFLFMLFVLLMPDTSSNAIKYGLTVCGEIVIPSIFPFAFLCILIYTTNISKLLEFIINKTPLKKMVINSSVGVVIIMSLIGGYPIGSKLISMLYKEDVINNELANILLMFCINPGPAFVIIAVGNGMLRSYKAGVILFIASTMSCIILGIILLSRNKSSAKQTVRRYDLFTEGIIKSISESTSAVINICSFVVIFSCIGSAIKVILPERISTIILSFLEVTNGCLYSSKSSIYYLAFIIAFSGFAVHFQVFALSGRIKINYLSFYIGRISHSILTVLLTYIIEKIFPVTINTSTTGNIKKVLEISATSVCSLCLICLSFVIMCYWVLSLKEIEEQKKNAR